MSFGTIRRDPADVLFSKCVRERTNWTCESCHKQFQHGAQNLHCSHLFSRRHMSTRYSPENAFAHCFSCHQRLGSDPVSFAQWAEAKMGPAKVKALHTKAHLTLKLSKVDKAYIAAHYRGELKRLNALRASGQTGYIQVNHWGGNG